MTESTKFHVFEASDVWCHYWLVRLQGKGRTRAQKRGTGRHGSWQTWTTGERGARSHSAEITPEQERVSCAQYDTGDTYRWRICKQYERYNAQTGYAWMHILYVLPLLPAYRATVLRFLAHRSLPITSRYYRTTQVSIPAEKLIKPTQVSKVPSILDT